MSDDPKLTMFLLREPGKTIKRVKSHGLDLITEGLVCLCGHKTFVSEKTTMFPFLFGKKWVEDIFCFDCQRIFRIELTEKDKLKEILTK